MTKTTEQKTKTNGRKPRAARKPKSRSLVGLEIGISVLLAIIVIFGCCQAYRLFVNNFSSRDGEEHLLYVYPETTPDSLLRMLDEHYNIGSGFSLKLDGKLMKWPTKEQKYVHTGCYRLPREAANIEIIRKFKYGLQEPVHISFNNIRTQGQLAARLASQLMLDSASISDRLKDEQYMQKYGLKPATAVSLFLPDSYEVYWDISSDRLFDRMKSEYDRFWNEERLGKAKALGLTPAEVATVASIVEEETNRDVDKPIIAGLYLNRIRIGMPLQACPTVKFALQDFSLRRITNAHLAVESPYNTYKYAGLPPGPIRIPTAKTLDYVLNPKDRDRGYLFMCASTAFDGTHHFSTTYAEHARYAREYQAALNRRNIH